MMILALVCISWMSLLLDPAGAQQQGNAANPGGCTTLATLRGDELRSKRFDRPKGAERFRVFFVTREPGGELLIRVTTSTEANRTVFSEDVSGADSDVLSGRFSDPENYSVLASPTDQRYRVVVQVAGGDDECLKPLRADAPTNGQYSPEDGGEADLDCANFDSQAEAQANLDANPSDPNNLDADNDGDACEVFDYGDGEGDVNDPNDVMAGTGDDGPLPDTGGMPLLFGAAALVLAAALAARRVLRP